MSFEMMPIVEADKAANGHGRDAPNIYPVLPEPVGRLSFVSLLLRFDLSTFLHFAGYYESLSVH